MDRMINSIKQHGSFFLMYLFVFTAGCVLLFAKGKADSFLLMNFYHRQWLDHFFIFFTVLGDGLFVVLLSIFCFFVLKKRKLAITLLIAFIFTGIVVQVIKPIVESPRPESFFYPRRLPFFIDDIIHAANNSFPSGHTVTVFAMVTVLVLNTRNKWYYLMLLLFAMLVGFSRIYLSQHFLADVLAGSLLGVLGGVCCEYWCRNLSNDKLAIGKRRNRAESTG